MSLREEVAPNFTSTGAAVALHSTKLRTSPPMRRYNCHVWKWYCIHQKFFPRRGCTRTVQKRDFHRFRQKSRNWLWQNSMLCKYNYYDYLQYCHKTIRQLWLSLNLYEIGVQNLSLYMFICHSMYRCLCFMFKQWPEVRLTCWRCCMQVEWWTVSIQRILGEMVRHKIWNQNKYSYI